jgi:hypothetical protein
MSLRLPQDAGIYRHITPIYSIIATGDNKNLMPIIAVFKHFARKTTYKGYKNSFKITSQVIRY